MNHYINKTSNAFMGLSITLLVQAAIVFTMVALVLYAVLFSEYPAVHDFFHHLRHSLSIIPCH